MSCRDVAIPAYGVLVLGVAHVDDDVSLLQVWHKLVNEGINGRPG